MLSLPVDQVLPQIRETLTRSPALVLTAEPGTGKTTRVPPALLEFIPGEILVLEPRRLAAKLSARRVAEERGEKVGETVGYQFRFENVSGPRTRLRFLTEGMLMRRLLGDPELKGVGAVVLDEFHERHLHGDVALAYLKRLQSGARKDFKLIVMSATIDAESVAGFLGHCPIIRVEGKRYDVDLSYRGEGVERSLERRVRDAIGDAIEAEPEGDVLVFLPGMAEIRRCESALLDLARERKLLIAPLHGELSREEQDLAVGATPAGRRKVVLSTNIAETSITIPGVRIVIDAGLARIASHSPWSGLPQLRTRPISKASAIQRAGRAGRTAPGRCIRLYSRGDFEGRAPFEVPEVQRADLAQTLLELHALGIKDAAAFGWFEAPTEAGLLAAEMLLYRLGAVSADRGLTEIGQRLVSLPLHPRLGRICVEGMAQGVAEPAARAAAFLSEGALSGPGASIDFFAGFSRAVSSGNIQRIEERIIGSLRGSLRGSLPGSSRGGSLPAPVDASTREFRLARCLLSAYPDRVGRRKGEGMTARELLLSGGGTLPIEPSALTASHEWFVVLDAGESQAHGQARMRVHARLVAPIESDWLLELKPDGVEASDDLLWNEARQRVESVSQMSYGALILEESRGDPAASARAGDILAEIVLTGPAWSKLVEDETVASLVSRTRFLRENDSRGAWPDLDEPGLRTSLREFCAGKSRMSEVSAEAFADHIRGMIPAEVASQLDRLAPTHVQLARGRRVRVNYEAGKPPWIESRLQDFFGMREGPKIFSGRVALTLHLLAPNQRAVQVTSDLAGFWQRVYPDLRRELGRRYPRHAWPPDPLQADQK